MSAEAPPSERKPSGALRQLLGASRPLSWVNTAYPFGAAYLLAGGGVDAVLIVGVIYFLVPYNLLMYGVNDVFDYESDLRNPRKGGVEGVVLLDRWHRLTLWAAALSNLPFVVFLVLAGTPVSNAVLAVVLFAVVAYSAPYLRFKERPLLDSVTSSTHFVGPAAFGLAMTGASLTASGLAAFVAFFLWGVASQAFGAVQDIEADQSAGIGSIATWLGASRTVWLAMAAYTAAGVLLLVGVTGPGRLAGLLAAPYVLSIWPFRRLADRDCEQANVGWRRFLVLNYVTGFLVTQLLIWIGLGGW